MHATGQSQVVRPRIPGWSEGLVALTSNRITQDVSNVAVSITSCGIAPLIECFRRAGLGVGGFSKLDSSYHIPCNTKIHIHIISPSYSCRFARHRSSPLPFCSAGTASRVLAAQKNTKTVMHNLLQGTTFQLQNSKIPRIVLSLYANLAANPNPGV